MLVTLSGVDCAGKTTQLELLANALIASGKRVKCVWFRPGYSQEMDLLRKIVRKASPRILPQHTEVDSRKEIFSQSGVSESWVAMALFDCFLQCACKVRIHLAQGYTVICDRFLQDAELDLLLRFPNLQAIYKPSLWALRTLAPTPNHAFLLSLPYEEVESRVIEKNEPFPDSDTIRRKRWLAYQEFVSDGQLTVIDASETITNVQVNLATAIGL